MNKLGLAAITYDTSGVHTTAGFYRPDSPPHQVLLNSTYPIETCGTCCLKRTIFVQILYSKFHTCIVLRKWIGTNVNVLLRINKLLALEVQKVVGLRGKLPYFVKLRCIWEGPILQKHLLQNVFAQTLN